jgi:hypothetical protein
MRRPTPLRLRRYAGRCLRLAGYLQAPGDGRILPRIPASSLLWALLVVKVLRTASLHGVEMLVRYAGRALGVPGTLGDDALAYFLERLAPEPTRQALLDVARAARRNKAFERAPRIGIALDGTGAGRAARQRCPQCHQWSGESGGEVSWGHRLVLASIVGAGIVLPVDVEPHGPEENELVAGKRLLQRVVRGLGRRYVDHVIVDSLYAGAPFLALVQALGLELVVGLKANLPDLLDNARAHFAGKAPDGSFMYGGERVELWDDEVEASQTLPWPSVRVLRYRQYRRDGKVLEAWWYTTFPARAVGSRALFLICKSRWEIENQGFNDAKNRYGLEHIPHHETNSILLHGLLTCLAMCIERLYRLRHLHRGRHASPTAIELYRLLLLALGSGASYDTS